MDKLNLSRVRGNPRINDEVASKGFRPDIQGMRAVAILLVLLYHAGLSVVPGGYVGVDVFFVISGFLITGHLLRELSKNGRIRIGEFYSRRIRRLLPASFVVILGTLLLAKLILPPLAMRDVSLDGVFAAAYLSNMWFAYTGTDYLGSESPSVFQHYWSLALEEQFYLVWPLFFILIMSIWKSVAALRVAIVAIIVVSFGSSIVFTATNQPVAFFVLPTRAWELGIGGLLAVSISYIHRMDRRIAFTAGWFGLGLIALSGLWFDETTQFPGVAALAPVIGATLVIAAGVQNSTSGVGALLALAPLQFVGKISYSLYLWHWPILIIPSLYRPELSLSTRLGLCLVAVLLAVVTEKYVESPFRKAQRSRKVVFSTAAVATVCAIAIALASGMMPKLTTERMAAGWAPGAVPAAVPVGDSVPVNIRPPLEQTHLSNPEIYEDGCHLGFEATIPKPCVYGAVESDREIVLFGDSHAAQYFPALEELADAEGFALHTLTKSACPSALVTVWNGKLQSAYDECDVWRGNALRLIDEINPETVVIANSNRQESVGAGTEEEWVEGLRRTIESLPDATGAVVLADGPVFSTAPAVCLSANLSGVAACSRPASDVLNLTRIESDRTAAESAGSKFIDTSEWYCPSGECPALLGDINLYRDSHHITVEFARALVPVLYSALSLSGETG